MAGRDLGVDCVLDGRVQKSGERIRVTVQLVRTSDGSPLAGGQFDEKYTDIFSVEDRISEQVVRALLPSLTGTEKNKLAKHYTEDTEAYQAYIKGRYYWNKRNVEGVQKAISYFEDAIVQDPKFALAYAGLADSYTTLGIIGQLEPRELMPKARSAALKAIELDDGLAQPHASLGYVKHRFEWDWAGAESEFKHAIELNDDYATAHQWYGWYLISLGNISDAQAQFRRAEQLEPLSLYTNLTAGAPYFYSGQYDKAAEKYKKVTEMDSSFFLGHLWLGRTYLGMGRYEEAISELQLSVKLRGWNESSAPVMGEAFAMAGRQAEARAILTELIRNSNGKGAPPYGIALIYAALGDRSHALDWIEADLKLHDDTLVFLNVEPRFVELRSDPRFINVRRAVGIPE